MKILIQFTNLDSTPAITEYVEEKIGSLARFLKRWDKDDTIEAQIELGRPSGHHHKGPVYRAEVNLHLPGKSLRAEHTDWDIRVAIDRVRERLQTEVKKYKELRTKK